MSIVTGGSDVSPDMRSPLPRVKRRTMKTIDLGKSGLLASVISLGCMRVNELTEPELDRLIGTALEVGINFFDHADVYGGGACEELFAGSLDRLPIAREEVILQSKCGIRQGMYDFS